MHNRSSSIIASETADADSVTDDSSSPNSTPGVEPVTPPTTPPSSDFTFSTSPNGLQRAISGNKSIYASLPTDEHAFDHQRGYATPTTGHQFGIPIMRVTGHTITRNLYEHYDYVP
ncbi:hypothetical protein PG994_002176 [Apiospora phragmitis]|uniref:Uncharacterized protein n=1 Tax=Apiospora phragmitis TaxID=2905665 RepID=A0ABR1WVL8_9PEZI